MGGSSSTLKEEEFKPKFTVDASFINLQNRRNVGVSGKTSSPEVERPPRTEPQRVVDGVESPLGELINQISAAEPVIPPKKISREEEEEYFLPTSKAIQESAPVVEKERPVEEREKPVVEVEKVCPLPHFDLQAEKLKLVSEMAQHQHDALEKKLKSSTNLIHIRQSRNNLCEEEAFNYRKCLTDKEDILRCSHEIDMLHQCSIRLASKKEEK